MNDPKGGVAKVTCPTFEAMGQIPMFHRTYFLLLLLICERGPRSPSKTQCPTNESPLQPLTLFFNIYAHKLKIIIIIVIIITIIIIMKTRPSNNNNNNNNNILFYSVAIQRFNAVLLNDGFPSEDHPD